MPYGTVNADVIGTSVSGSNLGAGNASLLKNRLINGNMVIDQRNAGASVSTTAAAFNYTLDRWNYYASQASKFTIQQNASSVTPPVGFSNYLGVTSLSSYSVNAGDIFQIGQCIEGFNTADLGWGTASAKTVTLSFQVYSSLTGTFGGSLLNSAYNRSYPFTYSVSVANTWTTISVNIVGDTSGTWTGATNGIGIRLCFGLGVGTTYSGTAGSWSANQYYSATGATSVVGTNGATFYITGVQLEVGSSATGFEYVNYQTSLANCQRYFSKSSSTNVVAVNNSAYTTLGMFSTGVVAGYGSGVYYVQSLKYPVSMRTEATITLINTSLPAPGTSGQWSIYGGSWLNSSSLVPQSTTTEGFGLSGASANVTNYMFYGAWTASAEL